MITIEVKINKEVRNYQERLFFGLNLRQLAFSALAVTAAVAVYFSLRTAFRSELLCPKQLVFKADNLYARCLANSSIREALKID